MPTTLTAAFNSATPSISNGRVVYGTNGAVGISHEQGDPATSKVEFIRANDTLGNLKLTVKNVLPSPIDGQPGDFVQNLSLADEIMRIEKQLATRLSPEALLAKSVEIRCALAAWLLKSAGVV